MYFLFSNFSADGQELSGRGLSISDGIDMIKGNSDNSASKQPVVLLCSEKAVYVYSLLHIVQVSVNLSCGHI